MSTLRVSKVETAAVDEDLVLTTGNTESPSLIISSANDNIFLNGTLYGLTFPEVNVSISYAYTTANSAANVAYDAADTANAAASSLGPAFDQANTALSTAQAAFSTANNAASTGKAIAMAIVFG